eukprot:10126442-Karenia_brevis.AAC.1
MEPGVRNEAGKNEDDRICDKAIPKEHHPRAFANPKGHHPRGGNSCKISHCNITCGRFNRIVCWNSTEEPKTIF